MSYRIIPREEWGAAAPKSSIRRSVWPSASALVLHHSAGSAPPVTAELRQDVSAIRGIDRFHYYTRGWRSGGVGYSYLVTPSGRIFEGRGLNSVGAHTPGHNATSPAVCIVGDYRSKPPTEDSIRAVAWLLRYLKRDRIVGHRDYYSTTCPGDAGYSALGRIRAAASDAVAPPPKPLPHSGTLRLAIDGRRFAGWNEARGPILWIASNSLDPSKDHAISWRGNVWRGAKDVENVSRNLARRYLGWKPRR